MKKSNNISAQRLVNTCQKSIKINWKQLNELVNKDRCECAAKGEWKEWAQ